MRMYGYRAHVLRDADNWRMNTVRLMLAEERGQRAAYLMADGTWVEADEGEMAPDGIGLLLPAGSLDAVTFALDEFKGALSHSGTEARVLREWLKVEQARVDRVLNREEA